MKKPLILFICLISASVWSQSGPKNIILFIGDGMGVSQVTAAKYAQGKLQMERCPVGGFVTTHCSNQFVTDSAAAGTALATGHKTTKGTIGMSPDGKPLKTALEAAEEKGKSTGLVVTCSITHATPACFATHTKKRKSEPEIAEQLAVKDIEVLFGGGYGFFIPQSKKGSQREDDKNVIETLQKKMTLIRTEEEFKKLGTPERVAGLFADNPLPTVAEGRISLPAMTGKALEILAKNKNGFFLMVEGSQIDWGGHKNSQDYIISEMIDFDQAVGVGLDFAQKSGDTLVVIVADHETGGFAVLDGSVADRTVSMTAFAGKEHSAAMVPLLAFGPGAEAFGGIQDNTDIGRRLIQYVEGR